jgi:hypothetical protein
LAVLAPLRVEPFGQTQRGSQVGGAALLGTTYDYGVNSGGTVFKLRPPSAESSAWQINILYSFTVGVPNEAAGVISGLIRDKAGRLIGDTLKGGDGYGAVFDVTP